MRIRAKLCALAIHVFYDRGYETRTNPSYAQLFGPLLTMLERFTRDSDIMKTNVNPAFKECQLQLKKVEFTTFEQIDKASIDIISELCEWIGLSDFNSYPQVFVVIAVSILILIGKNVVENNRLGWFKNRWRSLSHVAGYNVQVDSLNPPELAPCQGLYLISPIFHPIRCCLFKIMRGFAATVSDQNYVLFDRIIRLLQWTEMHHI